MGVAINEKDLGLLIGLIYLTGAFFFLFCFGLFDFVSGDSITLWNHSCPGTRFVLMWGPAASSSGICLCLPSAFSVVFMEFPGTAHYTLEWKRNGTSLTVGQHAAQPLALHTPRCIVSWPSSHFVSLLTNTSSHGEVRGITQSGVSHAGKHL